MGQRVEHKCEEYRLGRVPGELLCGHQVLRPQRGDVRATSRQAENVTVCLVKA